MYSGRFGDTSGRPYVEALVILPRLKIEAGISFAVDTGADQTDLMPADAITAGISYAKLARPTTVIGLGGPCKCFIEKAFIILPDINRLFTYVIDIRIADRNAPAGLSCPSILGLDVINRLRMIYNAPKNEVVFTMVSADLIVPLGKRAAKRIKKWLQSEIKKLNHLHD